jgi:hypothetical protein
MCFYLFLSLLFPSVHSLGGRCTNTCRHPWLPPSTMGELSCFVPSKYRKSHNSFCSSPRGCISHGRLVDCSWLFSDNLKLSIPHSLVFRAPQQMAYPAQMQQPMQPMQYAAPAQLQQVLPRAAVPTPQQATSQLSVVGNVKTERAEARRTSFQVPPPPRIVCLLIHGILELLLLCTPFSFVCLCPICSVLSVCL